MDLLALAKDIAERVETESFTTKVPVTVTVIDVHGNSVLQHRMNGALAFSMLISHRKAYTAALTQRRTADLFDLVQPGQELFHLMSQDSFCAMGGGAPLVHEGVFVGGVGISGGTVAQDVSILEAALQRDPSEAPANHSAPQQGKDDSDARQPFHSSSKLVRSTSATQEASRVSKRRARSSET